MKIASINLHIKKSIFLPCFQPYIEDYSSRYNVYYGGRGSGKTVFVLTKLLIKGLKEKRMILLMRKETNKLKDSVWKELKEAISRFKLDDYFEFNKTDLRAVCKINGTEFKCLGLDEPEKIKGFTAISDAFLDEVTAFTADDIDLIDGTLRSSSYKLPLQMYFCFNPISKANFVFKYFGFDTGIVPPNTFIHHSTYLDNCFLDASFLERMENLKQRNYNRWKVEALGEFVSLDKLVYTNWRVEDFNHTEIKGTLICGLDYGYVNDISAFTASIADEENKRLYIFKEWGDTNKTNDELANIISSMGFAKSVIIADCSEPKSIEEMKRKGISRIRGCEKGKDSILHGIQTLQQYEIIVHPSCVGVITEFENYCWAKDKNGEYINKPVDFCNHFCDSLRYSIQALKTNKLKTLNKAALSL